MLWALSLKVLTKDKKNQKLTLNTEDAARRRIIEQTVRFGLKELMIIGLNKNVNAFHFLSFVVSKSSFIILFLDIL